MQSFFAFGNSLPPDAGYALFSTEHIIILLSCLFIIAGIIASYLNCGQNVCRKRIRFLTALAPAALMVLRWIYILYCGVPFIYELPLHLCSMTGILCLIFEFIPDSGSFFRSVLGQALYALCLPGAVMALLFPDATYYPVLHFITLESFLFHALITAYILLMLVGGHIRPHIREAYKSVLFLLAVVPPVMIFDHHFGTNFMFLNRPSNGSPLTWFYFAGGYAGYLAGYAAIVGSVVCLMNLIGMAIFKRRK